MNANDSRRKDGKVHIELIIYVVCSLVVLISQS